MTSLISEHGGALKFDGATWPAALHWLSHTGWRIEHAQSGPGQMPRIEVSSSERVPSAGCGLSLREVEVLIGMSEGQSNAAIGNGLHLSEDTIKTHARHLFKKLGARDRAHAVALGFRNGILGGVA